MHFRKKHNPAIGGVLLLLVIGFIGFMAYEKGAAQQKQAALARMYYRKPQVILDAGHGGMDSGAVSAAGTCEKDLNLEITNRIRGLMKFCGVETVMTRDDDSTLLYEEGVSVRKNKQNDLYGRVQVAEKYQDSDFISIHMNEFEQAKYSGAQVFYGLKSGDSENLALLMQEALRVALNPENNRRAKPAPSSIYIMQKITSPAVIAECGFLSNPEEAALLTKADYQKKGSLAIVSSYLCFLAQRT